MVCIPSMTLAMHRVSVYVHTQVNHFYSCLVLCSPLKDPEDFTMYVLYTHARMDVCIKSYCAHFFVHVLHSIMMSNIGFCQLILILLLITFHVSKLQGNCLILL